MIAVRPARARQASFGAVVTVFALLFGGALALAFVADDGDDAPEPRPARGGAAVAAYRQAIEPAAREMGTAIVLGIRPDITDFRAGRISAAVFRDDMVARARQFAAAAAAFDRASVPEGLHEADRLFALAIERYQLAVSALFEAGGVDGVAREQLLRLGASLGDGGDELYDRADALVRAAA